MRELRKDTAAGFGGGLDLTSDALSLPEDRLRWAENARLTQRGAIQKRGGLLRRHVTALPAAVRALFTWSRPSGVLLLAVAGGSLYSAPLVAGALTWTLQGTGLSATATPSFAVFRDAGAVEAVYIADGVALRKFNGTTLSSVAGAPSGVTVLRVYNQRLLAVDGLTERLYFSALNNGDTLGNAGAFGGFGVVRTFGDQQLESLEVLADRLLLFHVSGISSFTGLGQDDIAIQAGTQGITPDVGTSAPFSVVKAEQSVYFLSDRGFYRVAQDGMDAIGEIIQPLLQDLDDAVLAQVVGVHDRRLRTVLWHIPTVGVVCYDYRLRAWTGPFTGGFLTVATTAMAESQNADGVSIVLRGDTLGFVTQLDAPGVFRDNASAAGTGGERYTMRLTLRRFYHNDVAMEKLYRRAYVVADIRSDPAPVIGWRTSTQAGQRPITGDTLGLITGYDANAAYDDPDYAYDSGGVQTFAVPVSGRGASIDIDFDDVGEAATIISAVVVEATAMGTRPLYRPVPPPFIPAPALPAVAMQLAIDIGGTLPLPVVGMAVVTQPG
jgi:hypothetical protein